jgi:hypothetical protein
MELLCQPPVIERAASCWMKPVQDSEILGRCLGDQHEIASSGQDTNTFPFRL